MSADDYSEREELFPFSGYWQKFFNDLAESLREALRVRRFTPEMIHRCAMLLYAIERLPCKTEGINIETSCSYSENNGAHWHQIQISEDHLNISTGEWHTEIQGTESSSNDIIDTNLEIGTIGQNIDPFEVMMELEVWLQGWRAGILDPECNFEISNDSADIDWDQPQIANAWDLLNDDI